MLSRGFAFDQCVIVLPLAGVYTLTSTAVISDFLGSFFNVCLDILPFLSTEFAREHARTPLLFA